MFSQISAALAVGATLVAAQSATFPPGVVGTGTMGPTNPTAAVLNTPLNQTSYSRLLTLNSIDDFCLFAPPTLNSISESETEEVAWCTKPRNNARLIPDGTFTDVSFIKTDFYVQIMGFGALTNLNILANNDGGGELDPHGAYGSGNPIGGNVTTNITGTDLNVAEWMQYIDQSQFCIRACTNANSTYSAAFMCWHELDEMGCQFVMPGNYAFTGFQSCDADVAYPPGWYPTATVDGTTSFSTFAQYFTGIYTSNGTPVPYTVGTTVTPTAAYFTPSSSNCQTVSTISNGILAVSGSSTVTEGSVMPSGSGGSGSGSGSNPTTGSNGETSVTGSPSASGSGGKSAAVSVFPQMGALVGLTAVSIVTVAAGVVMVL